MVATAPLDRYRSEAWIPSRVRRRLEQWLMPYRDRANQAASSRRHYELNRPIVISRAKAFNGNARARNRAIVDEVKRQPCADCGRSFDPIAMDFDHIGESKTGHVSDLAWVPVSESTLRAEIAKCEVVCAVCHRLRTAVRGAAIAS
jgi:hypothetical protein